MGVHYYCCIELVFTINWYKKKADEGWYILTNLNSLDAALKAYKARSGIEAMFKDCKSGGDNLENCKASKERLTRIVLLIAQAYTCAGLQGQRIKRLGQQKYVNRLQELSRIDRRHSNFKGRIIWANVDSRDGFV